MGDFIKLHEKLKNFTDEECLRLQRLYRYCQISYNFNTQELDFFDDLLEILTKLKELQAKIEKVVIVDKDTK